MIDVAQPRPRVAVAVVALSAVTLVACGSSSDDGSKADASASVKARPAASTSSPSTAAPSTAAPAAEQPEVPDPARTAQGTGRLSTLRLGTPGRLVVKPKGAVPGPGTEHWYKFGTVVTVRAKDTPTARFSGWAGDANCDSSSRICKVKIAAPTTVAVAGFDLIAKGAKGLKKSDPRLRVVTGD
jgi:hypothetical protein